MPWLSANPTISLHRLHLIRPHKLLGGPIRLCYQYDAIQIRAHSLIALMETIPAVKEKNRVFKEVAAGKNITWDWDWDLNKLITQLYHLPN